MLTYETETSCLISPVDIIAVGHRRYGNSYAPVASFVNIFGK